MTTKYQFNDEGLSKGLCAPECATYDSEFCYRVKDGKGEVVAGFDNESDARFFIAMRNGGAMELFLEVADRVGELDRETGYVLTTDCDPDGDTALDCLISSGVVRQVKEGE